MNVARILDRSVPEPNTGCWLWPGACDRSGRARTHGFVAARVVWAHVNRTLLPGECVLHRCDTPACINPSHLFVGTHAANVADKVAKGRQARGVRSNLSKLNDDAVRAIRASNDTHSALAARFSTSPKNVALIRSGRTWKHVAANTTLAETA
jgi:hypothetical protein